MKNGIAKADDRYQAIEEFERGSLAEAKADRDRQPRRDLTPRSPWDYESGVLKLKIRTPVMKLNKDNVALLAAILALIGALGSALVTVIWQRGTEDRQQKADREMAVLKYRLDEQAKASERRREQQKAVQKYAGPLSESAYELQSRIYNILEQDLLGVYLVNGTPRQRSYVIDNSVFVIAQYMAWTEIIRRDVQYIDLGQDKETKGLVDLQSQIQGLFLTDRTDFSSALMIFNGEQRGLGELMIRDTPRGPECMGYNSFLSELSRSGREPLLDFLGSDIQAMTADSCKSRRRLICLQHALVDLLDFLDPNFLHFPSGHRTKVKPTGKEVDDWCNSPEVPVPDVIRCDPKCGTIEGCAEQPGG